MPPRSMKCPYRTPGTQHTTSRPLCTNVAPPRARAGSVSRDLGCTSSKGQPEPAWLHWASTSAWMSELSGKAAVAVASALLAVSTLVTVAPVAPAHAALPAYSQLASSTAAVQREQDLFTDDAWQGMQKLSEYYSYVADLANAEAQPGCELCAAHRALLERAWQTVANEFYDPTGRFSQAWWAGQLQLTLQESGGMLHTPQQLDDALERLMLRLNDKYSAYLRPADFRRALRRPLPLERSYYQALFVGVGLQLGEVAPGAGGRVGRVVEAPLPGSPAEMAGIMRGDVVLDVDGVPLEALSTTDVAALLRGPAGSSITLTWRQQGSDTNNGGALRVAVLERQELPQPVVREARLPLTMPYADGITGHTPSSSDGFTDEVAYLRVYHVGGNTSNQVAAAVARGEMDGVAGYIIDLRNNPGGVFEEAIATAALFLEPGQPVAATVRNQDVVDASFVVGQLSPEMFDTPSVLLRATAGGSSSGMRASGSLLGRSASLSGEVVGGAQGALTHAPVAILVNGNSASAAEVLAGALHDNNRAVTIGVDTFGKGVVQWYFPLSGSRLVQEQRAGQVTPVSLPTPFTYDTAGGLKITVAKYLTPSGYDISRQGGLQPDKVCRDHPRAWQWMAPSPAMMPASGASDHAGSTAARQAEAAVASAEAAARLSAPGQGGMTTMPAVMPLQPEGSWRGDGLRSRAPGVDECIEMGLQHIRQQAAAR